MPQPAHGSVPSATPIYEAELEKAYVYAVELYSATDFVHQSTTSKGTKILMKDAPGGGSALPITRGEGKFPAKYTPDDILACLRHVDARKVWDSRFEDMEIIEGYGNDLKQSGLVHSKQKGQWPVISGRDFTVAYRIYRNPDNSVWFVQTSVTDPRLTEVKGRVRGHVTVAVWVIQPAPDGWDVTYIAHVDPAGTLPVALVKLVSSETPSCVGTVLDYLEKKGVPNEE
ncbi:hypothetical protein BC829DRAFT_439656 [Chytridium lagenaria]|nr:hypothetical protein BC829DRAFT_439656 [Chytridium lagenaria]